MNIAAELLEPVALAALSLLLILPAAWGVVALWYQANGGRVGKMLWILLWATLALAFIADLWRGHAALGGALFCVQFAILLLWWHRIPPSNQRPWADDVARMSHGSIAGDTATLYEVRNFDWQTRDEYLQRWETRSYNLNTLHSVDMILSYWTGPAIAHMLMSFGFADDEQLVFSVEIRRERGEAFSEVGGFFKQFELSIIACDERDVVRVRTNVRGEDAYLYRLNMPRAAMRSLFIGYVEEANRLTHAPRFYNTITVNCTTLVYHMMKRIVGYLPLDLRVLLTGYLPGYVYRVGGLDQRYTLDELTRLGHITERARRSDRSESFSADIRKTIPPLEG